MIRISKHALERFRERVCASANDDEAAGAIRAAVEGGRIIRRGVHSQVVLSGNKRMRLVLRGRMVVTVLDPSVRL